MCTMKKRKTTLPAPPFHLRKFALGASVAACLLLLTLAFSLFKTNLSSFSISKTSTNTVSSILPEPKKESSPTAIPDTPTPAYRPQISGTQVNVPILMYHYIGNNPNPEDHQRDSLSVTPDKFEEQMKYIADNGYSTTTFDTLAAALNKQTTLPNKTIILTFDDGYIDFYFNAYPILKQYNLRATVFIPTGLIDQASYLNWDQIKDMNNSSLISFQAHSVHHYHLPSLSNDSLKFELQESKRLLENKLGTRVNFIAYPFGSTDNRVIQFTKEAGFVGAAGTWANHIQSEGTIYDMPRLRVGGSTSLEVFKTFL